MKTVNEWLLNTKARDIMTREVACLSASNRLTDAVNLFLRDQITGAPVVDEDGVCIGVLSATDIVNFEEKREKEAAPSRTAPQRPFDSWAWCEDWCCKFRRASTENPSKLEDPVSLYMTRDVVSVTESTPLGVVLRMMIDAHVHRVLVLDSGGHLRGIVTTMDVLAAAVRAGRRDMATHRV
jgi:CBS domain-containing protein